MNFCQLLFGFMAVDLFKVGIHGPKPIYQDQAVRESLVKGTGIDTMFNMTKYAQDGILAVSINYRLGMFGFMNTFDEIENRPIGGNYGLMDIQVTVDRSCSPDYGRKITRLLSGSIFDLYTRLLWNS